MQQNTKKRKLKSFAQRNEKWGFILLAPWLVGVVLFLLYPLVEVVIYSFNDLKLDLEGIQLTFVGIENYRYLIKEHATFYQELLSTLAGIIPDAIIIVIFALFSGVGISVYLFLFPLIAIIQYVFTLGVVFIASALEIYVRDIEHIINFFVSMLFYMTPILYTYDYVPEKFNFILKLNPLAYIIEAYHSIFYYKRMPDIGNLGIIFVISVVIFFVGYHIFNKLQKGFAEEV